MADQILSPFLVLSVILLVLSSTAISSPDDHRPPSDHKPTGNNHRHRHRHHFVLVHGACHGSWSWYKVSTILKNSGRHNVTALDMASCGIDRRQAKTLSSFGEYFEPLMSFMKGLGSEERVVLVGHSFGGLGVAMAMEDFPDKISAAVFLAASMPGPNLSVSAINVKEEKQRGPPLDTHDVYENGPDKPPTGFIFGPLKLASHLYPLSPPEDLTLAEGLVRPHSLFTNGKKSSIEYEFVFTRKRYGSVKRAFILTGKDLMATKKFQRWMIKHNPPHITLELKGSDHMAMASKPTQLAHHLQSIANHFSLSHHI